MVGVCRKGNRDSWVGYWRYLISTPPYGIEGCYFGRMLEDADDVGGNAFSFAIAGYPLALERRMWHLLLHKPRPRMYDYTSYIITYLPWKTSRDDRASYLTMTVIDESGI